MKKEITNPFKGRVPLKEAPMYRKCEHPMSHDNKFGFKEGCICNECGGLIFPYELSLDEIQNYQRWLLKELDWAIKVKNEVFEKECEKRGIPTKKNTAA